MSKVESTKPNSEALPLRVHTLGQFVIERDGEAIPQGTKSQRKPLDLLKLLIALGGQSISVDTLSEVLWPDSDGDRAQGSFTSTLHRLRKLIGQQALSLGNARLSLDSSQCWVDAWAFADLVKQANKALEAADHAASWDLTEQALEVYGGPFLDGEFDLAEVLTAREKLHSQFLGHVSRQAEASAAAGEHDKAIVLFQKGLEIDDLAEEFYQCLMRCFLEQGRLAEGIAVYQRCKETLKRRMDIDLSPATDDIHQSLLDAQKERLSTTDAEPQPQPRATAASTPLPPPQEAPPADHEAGGNERPATPPSARDRPSIAVLAFENMSGDPEQEYFSDGISENIITDLASISGLLVVARNSSFAYKGKTMDLRQVGQELGAGYVLEGSVRKAGARVRISAQLIDAATGNHIWAKRFERNMEDIFALQDEITEEIVTSLDVSLLDGELQRVWRKYLKTYEARSLYRSGVQFFRRPTTEGNIDARQKFEQVMRLEPESPAGYNATGWTHWWDARYGWSEDPARSIALASDLVRESLEKDDKYPTANSLLASVFLLEGEFERAIEVGKQAEVLAPNHAHIVAFLAGILNYSGHPKEAIAKAQKAIRLTPSTPSWYLALLSSAYYGCGRYEEAIRAGQEGIAINQEELDAHLYKAAAHEALGQHNEAIQEVKSALESVPDVSLSAFAKTQPYKDQAVLDGLLDLLRKAGLPEGTPSPAPETLADISKDRTQPSIAVLPFENMSEDPEQEYFSDGITEDLITNLSKISRLSVTARNTVSTYKGKAVDVQQVGKELDVSHVLEGSVRKAGSRVRITAQLIDVPTGNHVWAERYDRELHDIFEVQDEITHNIVEALNVKLLEGEQARVWRQSTQNAEAYDYFLQGRHRWQGTRTRQSFIQGRQLYEQALALDGNFTRALAALAAMCGLEIRYGWSQSPQASMSQGFELVNRAIALDDSFAFAWGILAMLRLVNGEHDQALRDAEWGVSLNPNGAEVNTYLALAQFIVGKHKQALATSRKAVALTPTPMARQLINLGLHCLWSWNLEEARAALKKAIERTPDALDAHVILAAAHAAQGGEKEAKREAQEVLRIEPDFNLKEWVPRLFPFKHEQDSERMMELLRKAGLPEETPSIAVPPSSKMAGTDPGQEAKNIAEPVRADHGNHTAVDEKAQGGHPESVSATSLLPGGLSLDLPGQPSIAVLPFANMSTDPEQEYFSDGIAEDLITDLSRLPRLFVIARNSSFQFKGQNVDVRDVGEKLGVKYILEGSVRKSGDRVRITAQLIEAASGGHLWANRYDREMQDIFALQDEITRDIATELELKLVEGEQARTWRKGTSNLEAFDLTLRGRELCRRIDREDNLRGRQLLEKALELDPGFVYAMVLLGWTYHLEGISGRAESPQACFDHTIELVNKALSIDDSLSDGYGVLGVTLRYKGEHERAIECGERAVALNPNDADSKAWFCAVLVEVGRGEEALKQIESALRLNPMPPAWYLRQLGAAYQILGRFDDAIAVLRKCVELLPDYLHAHVSLVLTYVEAGREEEGREQAAQVLRISSEYSSSRNLFVALFKDPAIRERYIALLRKAGLPE